MNVWEPVLFHGVATPCDPMDCSLPGSSVHGILQARLLEWVAMPFSKGSSWPRDQTMSLWSPTLAGGLFTTERLHFHFSLSCTGEGNGNPVQYSCLENPRDGGAWWAAVYGVAQSWTWLTWLSSSSSTYMAFKFMRQWQHQVTSDINESIHQSVTNKHDY